MPTSKSARKRLRQAEGRRIRNKAVRTRLRTAVKKVRAAADARQASELFHEAARLLDRAAARGYVHPNLAARSKGRLAAHVQRLGGKV